jgi:hypothetical protein
MKNPWFVGLLCFLAAICGEARADFVTFDYQGRVTHAGQFSGVSPGDPFTATVTLNTTVVPIADPSFPGPVAWFTFADEVPRTIGITMQVGGGEDFFGFSIFRVVRISDTPSGDQLDFGGDCGACVAFVTLMDPSGKALSSQLWNVSDFDPRRWRNGSFNFNLFDADFNWSGVLTGLPASVPEQPSTLWCLATSVATLFAVARLERRLHRRAT